MVSASELVRSFYRALEAGLHGDALAQWWSDDVSTLTHPNLIAPHGGYSDLAQMVSASISGAELLSSQKYEVLDILEAGDTVIVRLFWTGVVRADRGPFRAGQELRAHIAQFLELRAGRISRMETYDCYEPLPAA